jgi:hypothetical protein
VDNSQPLIGVNSLVSDDQINTGAGHDISHNKDKRPSIEDDKSSSSEQSSNDSDSDNNDVGATPPRGKNAKSLLNLRQRILPTAMNWGGKPLKLAPQYKSSSESDSDNDDVGAKPPRGKNGKSLLNQPQRIVPTVQNLGGKTPRVPQQYKYHSVFQTFPCHLLAKDLYILKAIIEETTNFSFSHHSKATPQSILHYEIESWNTRKVTNTISSSIFDDNIGEDCLSAQSMYEKNIDNSDYQNALCPNQKLLHEVTTSHPGVKKIYVSVVRVINNLLMQISMNNTMTTNGQEKKSIHTNIAEVHASRVSCFPQDDIEFFEWTCTNKYGHLWYCPDISQSPILQRAIKKAIKKSWNYDTQSSLFDIETDGLEQRCNVCWICYFTQNGQCVGVIPHSQFCCFLYRRRTCHHCDMPPYCKESHFVEYARSNSSDCATHSIQDQLIVFNGHP